MKNVDHDKVIKDFFSNVLFFLKCELDKSDANKKAINHNMSCMLMFRSNPAKFTRPEEIKLNELFVSSDGLGDTLFGIVEQMIPVVCAHYNSALSVEKHIARLYKQSKLIMMKNNPLCTIKRIIFNNKLNKVY